MHTNIETVDAAIANSFFFELGEICANGNIDSHTNDPHIGDAGARFPAESVGYSGGKHRIEGWERQLPPTTVIVFAACLKMPMPANFRLQTPGRKLPRNCQRSY
jgi:hypothetical protein